MTTEPSAFIRYHHYTIITITLDSALKYLAIMTGIVLQPHHQHQQAMRRVNSNSNSNLIRNIDEGQLIIDSKQQSTWWSCGNCIGAKNKKTCAVVLPRFYCLLG